MKIPDMPTYPTMLLRRSLCEDVDPESEHAREVFKWLEESELVERVGEKNFRATEKGRKALQ
jgi:predicted transcriptional regulator